MRYWNMNGHPIKADRIASALHYYARDYLETGTGRDKQPKIDSFMEISIHRISKKEFDKLGGEQ